MDNTTDASSEHRRTSPRDGGARAFDRASSSGVDDQAVSDTSGNTVDDHAETVFTHVMTKITKDLIGERVTVRTHRETLHLGQSYTGLVSHVSDHHLEMACHADMPLVSLGFREIAEVIR